ncbi:OprD family outer membrane porin [Orbaceae bacterium ac157xtp]
MIPAYANDFIDDASANGNLFFWNRDRERKNVDTGKYESNLRHSTFNANIDLHSGKVADIFSVELGGYGAWEVSNGGNGHPNEIGFSSHKTVWDEKWQGDTSGLSFYKAQANLNFDDKFYAKLGYIQPTGQTLLGPLWSFLPGTFRGFEVGTSLDYESAGKLDASYMWADRFKAPWYKGMGNFRFADKKTKINYLHSVGLKYDFKNDFLVEAAFGQSQGYLNQYFAKTSYKIELFDNPLNMNYQFYGSKDQSHSGDNVYDGLAWLQAVSLQYQLGPVGLKTEGVIVKAEGKQGYFLQRMTPTYGSSGGRLDVWWNARSDFNANGERALFGEISYDLSHLSDRLAGWTTATSYAYGWNAKPNSTAMDQNKRIKESAWNFDLGYRVQDGWAKDTSVQLHYTRYNNHSDIPSWGGGFNNIFQDEKDIKFIVIMPFTIFNPVKK